MKRHLPAMLALLMFPVTIPTLAAEPAPKVTVVVGNLLPNEGGPAEATSPLTLPFGVGFDGRRTMFLVELAGGRVHRLSPRGNLTTIAGDGTENYTGDGGPPASATFHGMHNVAVAPGGELYIADSWNHVVRKISADGRKITTMAGTGKPGFSGDGGPATKAAFNYIMCVTLDQKGRSLYIADLKNRRIRAIDLETQTVRTVAGNGERGVPTDGEPATESPLVDPRAVTVDSRGHVYVLERGGHALRVVEPGGKIRTVAGTGKRGHRDGPALAAQFASPKHLCVDDKDHVIIADDVNAAIRKYNPETGQVTTVLGPTQANPPNPPFTLDRPHGVCFHHGTLYVVDSGNNRILRVE